MVINAGYVTFTGPGGAAGDVVGGTSGAVSFIKSHVDPPAVTLMVTGPSGVDIATTGLLNVNAWASDVTGGGCTLNISAPVESASDVVAVNYVAMSNR